MNSTNSLIDIKTNTVKKIDLSGIADKNKAYNINLADGVNVKFVANGTEYDTLKAWQDAQ